MATFEMKSFKWISWKLIFSNIYRFITREWLGPWIYNGMVEFILIKRNYFWIFAELVKWRNENQKSKNEVLIFKYTYQTFSKPNLIHQSQHFDLFKSNESLFWDNPLSNVHRCWLAMPLGAGFLRWVLACRTIEKKTKV